MIRPASFINALFMACLTAIVLTACHDSEADPKARLNDEQGKAFLERNKNEKGIVALDSGLQYLVLGTGNGNRVLITDTLDVHYIGKHLDGSIFDNSYERGSPEKIRVKVMIPGLKQALLRMHEGDKWRVFIPSYLAYTNRGTEGIEPNETIIYDLEVVHID